MKFIGLRDLRNKLAQFRKDLMEEKEVILTSNGKPMAIVSFVSEENLENYMKAFKSARAASAVFGMQKASVAKGLSELSLDEINAEIKNERNKRNS